ncbi:hypothetical protein Hanom_Chr02g00119331 [Helianthus anomalus]
MIKTHSTTCSRIKQNLGFQKIIRRPKSIKRARSPRIKSHPRLPFPTPMQQTNRSRMQIPAKSPVIIPT